MERWQAKVVSCLAMFGLTLVAALIPIKVYNFFTQLGKKGEHILSALMCFGGGVFFGTYMLHLMPEVRDILDHAFLKPNNIIYPVAELITAGGFFLVIFFEKLVLSWYSKSQQKSMKKVSRNVEINIEPTDKDTQEPNGQVLGVPNGTIENVDTPDGNNGSAKPESVSKCSGHDHPALDIHSARSFLLLLALSLHSIFEGLSIGLTRSVRSVWSMFIAVISHKLVIAFSLGLQSKRSYTELKPVIISAFVFAVMSPVGIGIGTGIMESSSGQKHMEIANGVLQALATGTFIYVTFFEVLQGEISHDSKVINLTALLVGFIVMALLSLVPEEQLNITAPVACNSCCPTSGPQATPPFGLTNSTAV